MKSKTNVYHIAHYTADKPTSLFFGGCNFSCKGCIRKLDVFDYHLKNTDKKSIVFLDSREIHDELKTWNLLPTNGFNIQSLNDVDEIDISIKACSDEICHTGKSNKRMLDNFMNVYGMNDKLRAETIPKYTDYQEIGKITRFISKVDPAISLRTDGYVPVSGTPWRSPTQEETDRAVDETRKHLENTSHRNGSISLKSEVMEIW